ncbi:hypothetical protein BD410DRAFT_794351 [Rickenella mellea]|uniref:Uncharacterized protein n=1 Tax=Rickenella mellea TaxID=50990 RepID=A0A4Y7PQT6_9AGAM|nr:hypothetical protein BD410DRAFT_794351 [Rickenella mellea]
MRWCWCGPFTPLSDSPRPSPQLPQTSVSNGFSSIDAEIKQLERAIKLFDPHYDDAAIHQSTASIVTLKRKRNRLAPVSRIPPEILSIIFQYIVAEIDGGGWWDPDPTSWRNGTAICSDWRAVALETPNLWTLVSSTYSRGNLEFYLLYSKSRHLRVRITKPYQHENAVILFQHLARIKELVINVPKESWNAILPFLHNNFPVLIDASLILLTYGENIVIGESVFRNLSPSLRRLSLFGMTGVPWRTQDLSNLLTLVIGDFSAAHFYTLMDACPNLQHISLSMDRPDPSEHSILSRRLPLHSLRSLSLSLSATLCEQVLHCLDLRDDVSLELNCYNYPTHSHITILPPRLLSSLSEEVSLDIALEFNSLGLDPSTANLRFTASTSVVRRVEVGARWASPHSDVGEAFRITVKLTESIIDRTAFFTFSGVCPENSQIWVDILTRMPQLQTLSVECCTQDGDDISDDPVYARWLIDALTSGISPRLRVLRWVQWRKRGRIWLRLRMKLTRMVRYRMDVGCPLDVVVVGEPSSPIFEYYSTSDTMPSDRAVP